MAVNVAMTCPTHPLLYIDYPKNQVFFPGHHPPGVYVPSWSPTNVVHQSHIAPVIAPLLVPKQEESHVTLDGEGSTFNNALQQLSVHSPDVATQIYSHDILSIMFFLSRLASFPHCSSILSLLRRGITNPSWGSAELNQLMHSAKTTGEALFSQIKPLLLSLMTHYHSCSSVSADSPSTTTISPSNPIEPLNKTDGALPPIEVLPFPGGYLFNTLQSSTAGSNNALVYGFAYKTAEGLVNLFAPMNSLEDSQKNNSAFLKPRNLERVAVKILSKKRIQRQGPVAAERCLEEISIAMQVTHPSIVRTLHVCQGHQLIYIVMEYANRGDLVNLIRRNGALQEREARHFFSQIVDGLIYLHSHHIAHRDIKPENVLLIEDRKSEAAALTVHGQPLPAPLTKWRALLADFGAAVNLQGNPKQQLTDTLGTLAYAAPEILSGKSYTGEAVDTWSLGIVLFAMIFGKLPWNILDHNLDDAYHIILSEPLRIPRETPFSSKISHACRDLLRQLIVIDPLHRRTLREIQSHPWIRNAISTRTPCLTDADCYAATARRRRTSSSLSLQSAEKPLTTQRYKNTCKPGNKTERYTPARTPPELYSARNYCSTTRSRGRIGLTDTLHDPPKQPVGPPSTSAPKACWVPETPHNMALSDGKPLHQAEPFLRYRRRFFEKRDHPVSLVSAVQDVSRLKNSSPNVMQVTSKYGDATTLQRPPPQHPDIAAVKSPLYSSPKKKVDTPTTSAVKQPCRPITFNVNNEATHDALPGVSRYTQRTDVARSALKPRFQVVRHTTSPFTRHSYVSKGSITERPCSSSQQTKTRGSTPATMSTAEKAARYFTDAATFLMDSLRTSRISPNTAPKVAAPAATPPASPQNSGDTAKLGTIKGGHEQRTPASSFLSPTKEHVYDNNQKLRNIYCSPRDAKDEFRKFNAAVLPQRQTQALSGSTADDDAVSRVSGPENDATAPLQLPMSTRRISSGLTNHHSCTPHSVKPSCSARPEIPLLNLAVAPQQGRDDSQSRGRYQPHTATLYPQMPCTERARIPRYFAVPNVSNNSPCRTACFTERYEKASQRRR